MICAWKQLLAALPPEMRPQVEGKQGVQEIRLRLDHPPELVSGRGYEYLNGITRQDHLDYVVNAATQYSPWCGRTMGQGYLTLPGGHRIGICGNAVPGGKHCDGFHSVTSVCIRVASDFPGVADRIPREQTSMLILGAPGWGKTTLLRDLTRKIADTWPVCVIDERRELFPQGIQRGTHMDVLEGFGKSQGTEMAIRTMSPAFIAVDEITSGEDCDSMVQASNCGVYLLASAHAAGMEDLGKRSLYRKLIDNRIFEVFIILNGNKSYRVERIVA